MKFTIDIEEFWLDEEELSDALQRDITHSVVHTITGNIKDQVEELITKKVTKTIEEKVTIVIDKALTDLIETGTLQKKNRDPISLVDHVVSMFNDNHGWSSPENQMKQIAERFGNELKARYDNIFAAKIVDNMKQQGLLKADVVQILLEGEKQK
jgi:benzoyl-CoA reductase/2-hydroxyglutaryl-CoA dehydratase subunit BcrC/BadD/HgdB